MTLYRSVRELTLLLNNSLLPQYIAHVQVFVNYIAGEVLTNAPKSSQLFPKHGLWKGFLASYFVYII